MSELEDRVIIPLRNSLDELEQSTDQYIRNKELERSQWLSTAIPDEHLKFLITCILRDLAQEQINRAQVDLMLAKMTIETFWSALKVFESDIATLKNAMQNMGIKNQSISEEVSKINTFKQNYEPILNHINDIIQARIRESEEKEKFDEEWRKRNK